MTENSFHVTGMGCMACVARVKKAVLAIDGVKSGEVDLAAERLTVVYDETRVQFDDIKNAVEEAGYGLEQI